MSLVEKNKNVKSPKELYGGLASDEEYTKLIQNLPQDPATPMVLVRLGRPDIATEDKYINMKDQTGREYVISLPIESKEFHKDILELCIKSLPDKTFDVSTVKGGRMYVENLEGVDNLVIVNKSDRFGGADNDKVISIVQKAFPNLSVINNSFGNEEPEW